MSPAKPVSKPATPVSLQAAKSRRLGAAMLPLLSAYEAASALDVAVLLKVAERPDIRPHQVAEELGITLPRCNKIIYGLEKGRVDNAVKALGLVEIRAPQIPGERNARYLRLTPKGERLVSAMLEAAGG